MIAELLRRTGAVAARSLRQLRNDRRLVALSVIFPLLIIYFIKVLFDVLAGPLFDISVYVVPYGAFIVHFITFVLTAIVLVRERTSGTLARMFVCGYGQIDIIGGYLLSYTGLATVQSLMVLVELNWLFELGYSAGQLGSIFIVMWLLAVISMAIGILVSNFARNEGQVFPFVPLVLISVFVSGIIVPVDRLPDWTGPLSLATPLYYANEILQNLIRGGVLGDDWGALLSLPLYGLAVMSLAMLTLREKD